MFFFHRDTWKPNSIYLAHLALADSLVLFCLPFRADYYRRGKDWVYGDAFCPYFTLSFGRQQSRRYILPHCCRRGPIPEDRSPSQPHQTEWVCVMPCGSSAGLWVLIIAMTVYLLTDEHFYYLNNHTQCESFNICFGNNSRFNWHNVFYVLQFFVPTAIVIYCTTCITWQLKSKTVDTQGKIKRAVQFILTVAAVFIICFFPSNISRIAMYSWNSGITSATISVRQMMRLKPVSAFTYFNSVLNPIVYYFSSPAFSDPSGKSAWDLWERKLRNNYNYVTIFR